MIVRDTHMWVWWVHIEYLRELMREDRELSAVARACILSSGDPRLTGILQSA
jgi:hypothetical protein